MTKRWFFISLFLTTVWFGPSSQAQDWIYTTRPDDTIWDLTAKYLKSMGYVNALRKHNNVEIPKLLQPGTKLRFPVRWLKLEPASAKVSLVNGGATFRQTETATPRDLIPGEELRFGNAIGTADDGSVVLEFADGSTLTVRPNSLVTMDKLSTYGDTGMVDTHIKLQRGRLNIKAEKSRGPGSRFRIDTPAAVSTVRGTGFRLASETDVARIEVTEGIVDVSNDVQKSTVPENYGILATAGEPLPEPRELLPPPSAATLADVIDRVPVRFSWNEVSGAGSYRVQVSPNRDFTALFVDRIVAKPRVTYDLERDGRYFMRLRSLDADKLEGTDLTHGFELAAYPLPPSLVTPAPEAKLRIAQPDFKWASPKDARGYQFQISTNEDFSNPLYDSELAKVDKFQPDQALAPGQYYWRIATRGSGDKLGPFGDAAVFTYEPPPPAPTFAEPSISKEEISIYWSSVSPGDKYHLQFARGKNFEKMLVDTVLDAPSYTLVNPKPGDYSFRVATIDEDTFEGAFGQAQTLNLPRDYGWLMPAGFFSLLLLLL